MLVGVHENRDLAETKVDYPRVKMVRRFIPGVLKPQSLVDKVRRLGEPVWSAGGVLVVSFKPDVKSVMNGDWDTHLQGLAAWLKQGPAGPTFIVPWHEPENDLTAHQFVSMFNRVRTELKSEFPQLTVVHSAMAYQYRPGGKADRYADWLTEADLNTCDVYSGKSFPLEAILPEHPGFKRWLAMVGPRSWGITERGFHATPGDKTEARKRAETIRREAQWVAKQPTCILYIYWNTTGTEDNPELVVGDNAGKEALLYLTDLLSGGQPVEPTPTTDTIQCPTCKGKGRITVVHND